ncbi:S-phase kinase-associated protein 2 [Pelobates fuscus]|uniref:S-phase kinase-associated protein 2 n=1 Tax=Pelobates fuscus TaxID=191477 RepID=UPI002FE4521F
MERRALREISASSRNGPNLNWSWTSRKSVELFSGMGVSPMEKDPQDTENTPRDLIMKMTPPQKRAAPREKDDTFVLARRPRFSRPVKPAMSWHAIPDELLLNIFSYLHLTDLLRAANVCKRWNRLSCDESLWYSLDLCGKHLADGVFGRLLSCGVVVLRCPRTAIGEPMLTDVGSLRLQHVDLSNCTVSTDALQNIFASCSRLQNLALEGLELSDGIMSFIAQNSDLIRLNLGGCSGFSPEALTAVLKNCTKLSEFNLSWCDFTAEHVQTAASNFPSSITELNFSGYRQNLEQSELECLAARCPNLTSLDLSDSVLLTPDCFDVLKQLPHLQHLGLSRCYQICPTTLLEFGKISSLKTLEVFGIVTDSSLQLLKESLPHIKINCSFFNTIARPTMGTSKRNREIWGIKCKLTLLQTDALWPGDFLYPTDT